MPRHLATVMSYGLVTLTKNLLPIVNLNKKVIVILISGRVLAISEDLDNSDAFIAAWLPGSEGAGVADFLFATDGFKPRGKSPFSLPVVVADIPLAPNADHALFKFGYGLQNY